ncbi:MAG: methionine synthase [Aristaeellaceae bacterium]
MPSIPMREALHYMGWRGTPVEPQLLEQIQALMDQVHSEVQPHAALQRFAKEESGRLAGTSLIPQGNDVARLLSGCHEAVLLAATLGAGSERMLLKTQARSGAQAVLLDAVLSAAIEAVCDAQEAALRRELAAQGLYLTDRFSPGYGDMPLVQTKEICAVLSADKTIGLTVSASGIMIPRKSVTAIMGVSRYPVSRRPSGCAGCSMRERCALRRNGD